MLHDQQTILPSTLSSLSSEATVDAGEAVNTLVLPEFSGTPAWKRAFDIAGSLALLVALSPILFATAVFIKAFSRGPVFYTQSRMGAGGKHFVIFKFRTMHQDEGADAAHREYVEGLTSSEEAAEKPDHEDRLITGGDFIRSHSLDELPQLFNVLMGTMSLVGPRPEVLELEDYQQWQLRRFEVLPGMTGLWQVSGKNSLSFNRMIELDIEYVDSRSLWNDIRLLFRTIRVVVFSDNG